MKSAKRESNLLNNITDMEKGYTFSQAVTEASRCLLCHDAPCSKACPASTDPGRFIRKLRLRNIKGAVRTIKENNILGGICALVCPTEELCQKSCCTTEIDRPIEIGKLQRFLVEYGWETGFNPIEKKEAKNFKVAIIGSGPAGLACGAELAKAGIEATIFEAKEKPGGVLRYGVPEFRLNSEILDREIEEIKKLGVKIECNRKIKEQEVDDLINNGFDAVFIATGIWKPYKSSIPGSELKNVTTATEFLESARNGNKRKITTMVKGKNVAVVGGGSVAMDVATTCKGLGANKVYILYRRSMREMPASKGDLQLALDNFVIIKPQTIVTEIVGEKGKITGLKGIETDWAKPGIFTAENLKPVPGTEFSLRVDAFVIAIGTGPDPDNRVYSKIKFKDNGLINTEDDGVSTTDKKIYAGGDIVRGAGLVVEAVADGKEAAKKIVNDLAHKGTLIREINES
jgi:NADPH-dependent glutamate synthase beta subunit-like oxidoreductase